MYIVWYIYFIKTMKRNIPYGRQSIDKKDIKAVIKVLTSDRLTQGPSVRTFENALSAYTGAKYAVAVSNGTVALHVAYLAASLGKGDEVITTPHTFAATSNMLLAVGAKPVFCDIELTTYNIDESKIESLITKKTKAIVPVHFAGHPCAMKKILKIARKHKLLVIEDGAHALGTSLNGKNIGSIGDMTTFSFHPVKNITTGEGGAITTNSKKLYERLLLFRNHGIQKNAQGRNVMTELGFNYRITDIQCALGISQLKKLTAFQKRRENVARYYFKHLNKMPGIILPLSNSAGIHAWHLFVIRVAFRKRLLDSLQKVGIGVQIHHTLPVYRHVYYQKHGYKKVSCKNAEEYYKTCLSIPIYPDLTRGEQDYVIAEIRKCVTAK